MLEIAVKYYDELFKTVEIYYPKIFSMFVLGNQNGHEISNFAAVKTIDLYNQLCLADPDAILELGTGYSTATMLMYAIEIERIYGKKVTITTVDENSAYQMQMREDLNKIFTKSIVDNYIQFNIDNVVVVRGEGFDMLNYEPRNDYALYDFLYIDGPDTSQHEKFVCLDAINIIKAGHRPERVLFDCRHDSVNNFSIAAPMYIPEYGNTFYSGLLNNRHHSVFKHVSL